MKKSLLTCLFMVLIINVFAQDVVHNKQYYLDKSKRQKGGAWALLGGGAVAIGVGLLVGDSKESSFDDAATGGIVVIAGSLAVIGSVPLFIASARNKRKAQKATALFKMEPLSSPAISIYSRKSLPALSVRINI